MHSSRQHFRFVEKFPPQRDLTFTFFDDGRLTIENNDTGEQVKPSELRRESKDFYVQRRISYIKNKLIECKQRHAQ